MSGMLLTVGHLPRAVLAARQMVELTKCIFIILKSNYYLLKGAVMKKILIIALAIVMMCAPVTMAGSKVGGSISNKVDANDISATAKGLNATAVAGGINLKKSEVSGDVSNKVDAGDINATATGVNATAVAGGINLKNAEVGGDVSNTVDAGDINATAKGVNATAVAGGINMQ